MHGNSNRKYRVYIDIQWKGNCECSATQLVDWIGHNFCRNYLLKHLIEVKVEGKLRREGRLKRLLDGHKERKSYWNWRQKALERTLWRTRFGRSYGPVVRETAWWRCKATMWCKTGDVCVTLCILTAVALKVASSGIWWSVADG